MFSAAEIYSRLIFPFVSFVLFVAIFIVYHAKPESMRMSCCPECHEALFWRECSIRNAAVQGVAGDLVPPSGTGPEHSQHNKNQLYYEILL